MAAESMSSLLYGQEAGLDREGQSSVDGTGVPTANTKKCAMLSFLTYNQDMRL